MNEARLDERVSSLEREVADLKAALAALSPRKAWRQTIGMFRNDPVFKEIIEAGQAIRDAERSSE